jgi:hypothetical protein
LLLQWRRLLLQWRRLLLLWQQCVLQVCCWLVTCPGVLLGLREDSDIRHGRETTFLQRRLLNFMFAYQLA